MTQQNAANSEESAASALELDNLAHKMQKMVDAFQLGEHEGTADSSHSINSKSAYAGKARLNKKAGAGFNDNEWKPNGRDGLANLGFSAELDSLKDF